MLLYAEGISLPAVTNFVAIELLTHGIWRFGTSGNLTPGESGVVPLAFPLLAGPGAITSIIISFQTAGLIVTILSIWCVLFYFVNDVTIPNIEIPVKW